MKSEIIIFGPFVLDCQEALLTRDGLRVPIRPQVLKALIYLAKNHHRVVSREDLGEVLWPGINVDEGQSLNVLMNGLRETLGDEISSPLYLETIPKRGYRFIGVPLESKEFKKASRFKIKPIVIVLVALLGLSFLGKEIIGTKNQDNITINDLNPAARSQFLLAIRQAEDGAFEKSQENFFQVSLKQPNFAESYYWLGKTQYKGVQHNLETATKAKPYFLKALELKPGFPEALIELGYISLITEFDASKAAKQAEQALELNPQNSDGHLLLVLINFALDDPEGAVRQYKLVNINNPTKDTTYAGEGYANFMAGEYETAIQLCQISLQAGTKTDFVRTCLFESYLAIGDLDKALEQAKIIMEERGASKNEIEKLVVGGPRRSLENFYLWYRGFFKSLERVSYYSLAILDVKLGDYDAAINKLQTLVKEKRSYGFALIPSDPRLIPLRAHPEAASIFNIFK